MDQIDSDPKIEGPKWYFHIVSIVAKTTKYKKEFHIPSLFFFNNKYPNKLNFLYEFYKITM